MKILILGAAGFLGTNLTIKLAENEKNIVTLVDRQIGYFSHIQNMNIKNIIMREKDFQVDTDFDELLEGQETVYHLVSTTIPANSNEHIPQELEANVVATSFFLEACVRCKVKRVIFVSSGGAVYGKELSCPLRESFPVNPITSYGIQKVTIEKLLYLYQYMYGLDYRIVRLANPYGPYQKPDGILGAVTTFIYKALKNEEIKVYGDGSVVRDFIYIDDAIGAIITVADGEAEHRLFNVGCGYGISINELVEKIKNVLNVEVSVVYEMGRSTDVPVNYLDISRYEETYGKLNSIDLEEGIRKTADFMKKYYRL